MEYLLAYFIFWVLTRTSFVIGLILDMLNDDFDKIDIVCTFLFYLPFVGEALMALVSLLAIWRTRPSWLRRS